VQRTETDVLPLVGRFWAWHVMNLLAMDWLQELRERRLAAYAVSLLAVAAATILTQLIPPLHLTPEVLFFAAIVVAACLGGKGPAAVAIVLSTITVDFFLIAPKFSLLSDLADIVRLFTLAAVAFVVCYLQENYHRAAARLREANEVLEARVAQRTADLAAANASLTGEVQVRLEAEAALKESETNLRLALDTTETSLREKEILNRELNHRVKNNLQVVTSLLSLQATRIDDPRCRELFKECQQRVRAIALVHTRLCASSNLASIDLAVYFRQLVQELLRSYRVEVDETPLSIDRLIPCALIVNELVCNAFKYAFPAGQSGEVRVEVHRAGDNIQLTVADDGVGFRPLEPSRRGVGLQIVQALVDQLAGRLEWTNGRGSAATITFPQRNPTIT
jgi:two-component sensor histidine kinase